MTRVAALVVLALSLAGCNGELSTGGGDAGGSSSVDASTRADAGVLDPDGGGAPDDDAGGLPRADGGDVPVDAGGGPVDAGIDATIPMPDAGGPPTGCSAVGLELIRLVNEYRADNGLPAIAASPSLCVVSSTHTRDLADNSPHTAPGGCNMHSWSDRGSWSPCCYTPDHAAASCMWDKPRELTVYPGNGYENAYRGSSDPAAALAGWMGSSGHNDVILNRGIWASQPWRALGADVHDGFAVLWFGREVDPAP